MNCICRKGQQAVFGPQAVVAIPPLCHRINSFQSLWAYQNLPPVGMPWFWPVSILDHSIDFFFPSYLLYVSIVWTITDLASHYPLGPSYSMAKFSLILWTCPAKPILPSLDPSLPACEITSEGPCEEAPFWDRPFPEAPRINQDQSPFQLPLTLGFKCLVPWAFLMAIWSQGNSCHGMVIPLAGLPVPPSALGHGRWWLVQFHLLPTE